MCPNCNADILKPATFCPSCGQKISFNDATQSKNNKNQVESVIYVGKSNWNALTLKAMYSIFLTFIGLIICAFGIDSKPNISHSWKTGVSSYQGTQMYILLIIIGTVVAILGLWLCRIYYSHSRVAKQFSFQMTQTKIIVEQGEKPQIIIPFKDVISLGTTKTDESLFFLLFKSKISFKALNVITTEKKYVFMYIDKIEEVTRIANDLKTACLV